MPSNAARIMIALLHHALGHYRHVMRAPQSSCCATTPTSTFGFAPSKRLPIIYEGCEIDAAFRIGLLVSDAIVVEIKAVEAMLPIHRSQLLTYLKFSGCRLGFLMNFNVQLFKDGVQRLII